MPPDDVGSIAFPFAHIAGPDYLVTMLAHGLPGRAVRVVRPGQAVPTLTAARRDDGRRQHGLLPAVPHRAAQAARRRRSSRRCGMMSGGGAPKPPELFYEVRARDRRAGLPRLRHDRVPDDRQGSPHDTDEQLANTRRHAGARRARSASSTDDGTRWPRRRGRRGARQGPDGVPGLHRRRARPPRRSTPTAASAPATSATSRADGHIVLTGRLKDVIIRKGENISAQEIEDLLLRRTRGRRRRGDRAARPRARRAGVRGRRAAGGATRSTFEESPQFCATPG